MSVFRAAASDPAYRPSIEAPHPASAAQQRHPLPPGQWVPPQRAQDAAYTDGPTEPLGTTREAAAREIAIREAEAREAAAREVAFREAEAREAAAREVAAREVAFREAEAREAAAREVAAREVAFREAEAREAKSREAAVREAAVRESEEREAAVREAANRRAAVTEANPQDAVLRDAVPRDAAARDAETRGATTRTNDARAHDARGSDARAHDARDSDARTSGTRGADGRDDDARGADVWGTGTRGGEARGGEARGGEARASDGPGYDIRDAESRKAGSKKIGSKRGDPATDREDAAGDPRAAVSQGSARPRRRPGVVLAVLLSLLALLISGATGFLSWQTFRATTSAAMTRTATTAPQPSAATAQAQAPAQAEARPPRPESYPVAYAKEPLRLQLDCAAVMFLDLDEPRADAAEALGDLRYESRCGTRPARLSLGAGAAGGSRQASADTDAAGCDRAIRTSPLGRGLPVEVRRGTALCVLTAATPAELVLVEIIDVGGSGTAGLRATSWQVP